MTTTTDRLYAAERCVTRSREYAAKLRKDGLKIQATKIENTTHHLARMIAEVRRLRAQVQELTE